MEKGLPADAHDAGFVAVEWKKGFPADAHDAGFVAVDWKKVFQLMLMMLGSWRWTGKGGFQLLLMLGSWRWRGKRFSS